ncbi:MAG: protein kinase [Deltaproteobacteria bacterium]|nr:protein kinase [Deltaproteobacteria bacterium]
MKSTRAVFAEGQVLQGTYRVVRRIGEGGMGVVYEATHARLAGRYAVKVLLRKLSDNPEALARFNREARITSSLQHPNIVQVIDFNTHTDGTEYLVMEYLQGETLAERLAGKGALPMNVVAGIVDQVAAGLAAAHSHAVVHRDLKPDNVFLLPIEGRTTELAKVLDFGISKVTDTNLRGPESALMGTPQYMSPEQCQGRAGEVDATTDQFALAVITYEMLTGRPPFVGDSVGTVLSQVLYAEPPPMGIDADEVERVVRRGLAKSKHDRFPSVTAFAAELRTSITTRLGGRMNDSIEVGSPTESFGELTTGAAFDRTIPEGRRSGLHRPRRSWGAVLIAVGAVSATFLILGARKIGGDGTRGMLPAPILHKDRLVDLTLQPPRLPALTAAVPAPVTPLPSMTESASEQIAEDANAQALSSTGAPQDERMPDALPDVAPQPTIARVRPPVGSDKRAVVSNEPFRRPAARPSEVWKPIQQPEERQISPPPTNWVPSVVPPPRPVAPPARAVSRANAKADDDAILPLDENIGEAR